MQKVGGGDTAAAGLLQFSEAQGAFAAGNDDARGIGSKHLTWPPAGGYRVTAPDLDRLAGEVHHRAGKGIEGAYLVR